MELEQDVDGASLRSHLESAEEQTGEPEPMLDGGEPPELVRYIWEWFWDMQRSRQSGFSANPLTFAEVESWSRLNNISILPWEVRAVREMDDELLRFYRTSHTTEAE